MSGPARTTNVVLVHGAWADGSSWNDAVIGADTNETVRSLVFIAASAPDEGETVAEVFYRDKPNPQAPQLIPDAHLDAAGGIRTAFSQHASVERTALFAATQRPIAVACNSGERSSACLESEAVLVSARRGRPHDKPGHPAFYGAADGRTNPLREDRSYTAGHCAGARHRHNPRGRRESDGVTVQRRCVARRIQLDSGTERNRGNACFPLSCHFRQRARPSATARYGRGELR